MEVPGEVQVDTFHGDHLGVSAARGATFHPKDRAKRWLAQGDHGFGSDQVQRIGQTDRDGGFAFPGGGGGGAGN